MLISDDIKYKLFMLIANKAKNNIDKEAYIDLNEININRNEDNALELKNWLKTQENVMSVIYNGHCNLLIKVDDDFIDIYSTEE